MIEKIIYTAIAIGILLTLFIITKIVLNILLKRNYHQRGKTLIKLVINLIRYIVFFLGLFIILGIWQVNTSSLLAGAGFLGVLIGIGGQKLMQDTINGFFIIFENHFNIGDSITVNGSTGSVIDMGLKTTTLLGYDGKMYIFSNGDITNLINHSRYPSLAIVLIKVSYENDYNKVELIIKDFINKYHFENNMIIGNPIYSGVDDIDSSGVTYRIIAQTVAYEHFGVERYLKRELLAAFQKNDIIGPTFFVNSKKNEDIQKN